MASSRLALALIFAIALLCAPSVAFADDNAGRALELYDQGSKLLLGGDPRGSLAPLEASMKLLPSPNTELLVGHAERQLGHEARALDAYVHVRATAKERVAAGESRFAPTLRDAEHWITVLTPEVCDLTISVAGAPHDAVVFVEDREVRWLPGSTGAVRTSRTYAEPGRARIELRHGGKIVARRDEELPKGARAVTLTVNAESSPSDPSDAGKKSSRGGGVPFPPIAAWVAGGIGAAGMISFAAAGGVALAKAGELDACAPDCDPNDPDLADARDTGNTAALVANVSVGIGAAGLVTGALLWIFWPRKEVAASSVTVDAGPATLRIKGSF